MDLKFVYRLGLEKNNNKMQDNESFDNGNTIYSAVDNASILDT